MPKGIYPVPVAVNEPVKSYLPGSPERIALKEELERMRNSTKDVPMYIGSEEVRTGKTHTMSPPHNHKHALGEFHEGDKSHVEQAINAALGAKEAWANMPWEQRASIFLKAAELMAGPYRAKVNASTMLAQSKNIFQAEIDAACEMVDFLRFNV
jgi:1-pyrroline-5-carboxylate dehydrogenase